MEEKKEIGLYVHIPFCRSKCFYCDFVSYENKDFLQNDYIKAIQKEIVRYTAENEIMSKHKFEKKYILKTIYIGGGTPSVLDDNYIVDLMYTIKQNFQISDDCEITIEVNPGTVTKEKLESYFAVGINRLSIGLQASQEKLLKEIGRIHTYNEFTETYIAARNVGFKNINVDLMIGLPNQTIEDVEETIKTILNLKPEHISIYSLILEEHTKLYKMIKDKNLEMISDELERQMYWYVKDTLEKHKYYQYEISNFAKPGFESRHNLDCWNQREYIGIGASASSFIEDKRYSNIPDVEGYINNIKQETPNKNLILEESLNYETKMNEYMILGLRKINGINVFEFEKIFNKNPVVKYCKQLEKLNHEGLIIIIDENIKLTNKGIDLANLVWTEFV